MAKYSYKLSELDKTLRALTDRATMTKNERLATKFFKLIEKSTNENTYSAIFCYFACTHNYTLYLKLFITLQADH